MCIAWRRYRGTYWRTNNQILGDGPVVYDDGDFVFLLFDHRQSTKLLLDIIILE